MDHQCVSTVAVCVCYLGVEQHVEHMVGVGLSSPLQSFRQELVLEESKSSHEHQVETD